MSRFLQELQNREVLKKEIKTFEWQREAFICFPVHTVRARDRWLSTGLLLPLQRPSVSSPILIYQPIRNVLLSLREY